MAKLGGTKGWLVLASVATVLALAVVPAVSGTTSATPAPISAANSPSSQWAYGGVGWSNNSLVVGSNTLVWNASFGWTVVFTATNTSNTTVQIEEQRTVGVSLEATFTNPTVTATYTYAGHENDVAFANLTDAATVYERGVAVPALGIDNATSQIAGHLLETISVTDHNGTKTASLDVTGTAHTAAQFTPALGLIPLNLSGATTWNSSAWVNPSGAWNITAAWANNGFLGRTGSGTVYSNGTAGTAGTVNLTGYDVTLSYGVPVFSDHHARQAIILVVEGPLGNYDAFVFVPHSFDLFGTEAHAYDSESLGSATISAETLYVSPGARGPQVTAASTTFGAGTQAISTLAPPVGGNPPAASSTPGTTVTGQPMSVSQAQAESNCLSNGCANAAAATGGLGGLVVVAALVVVAVVGTIVVVSWRANDRRKAREALVPGASPNWQNGVPPAAAGSVPQAPLSPNASGPAAPEDPAKRF
jgi:hypothetical protein